MMRSLFAGVSALRNHQTQMDVIGNNIANVNTIGFKASRATFKELLSQTLESGTSPTSTLGGTNPKQVGLGVALGAITNIHTQGNLQSTGVTTDLAIQGNGFFVVGDGQQQFYTRAGLFDIDRDGNLIHIQSGQMVYGWLADSRGQINTSQPVQTIRIPQHETISPRATERVQFAGNLDARITGSLFFTNNPMLVTDGENEAMVTIELTPTGGFNEWRWRVNVANGEVQNGTGIIRLDADGNVIYQSETGPILVTPAGADPSLGPIEIMPPAVGDANGGAFTWSHGGVVGGSSSGVFTAAPTHVASIAVVDSRGDKHDLIFTFIRVAENSWIWQAEDATGTRVGEGTIEFDSTGAYQSSTGSITLLPTGANPLEIIPDFSRVTQYADSMDANAVAQDGYVAGTLESIFIDTLGRINGSFSNGLIRALGQLALATFTNPAGLLKREATLFQESPNSGQANIGPANTGSRGTIAPENLEMSNVDLAMEFTNMIVTQRGYQANSRVITTADEMLQELVNLKR